MLADAHERNERLALTVWEDPAFAARHVAHEIAALIRTRAAEGRACVLGLATGATPVGVYDELARLHAQEGLSFANVTTFNLDEYWPMQPDALQSYRRFMQEHLFDRVDLDPLRAHLPDGTAAERDVASMCARYEEMIADMGGLDLQLLGIGRTGHIGFNEPGSARHSRTRLITLDRVTRKDAASDFFGEEHVPPRAVTLGVGTILSARRIVLLAFGEGKSAIVQRVVEGPVSGQVPATFLQEHPNVHVHLDRAAASQLVRERSPWQVGEVRWEGRMPRKAVVWLSSEVRKPILKLTNEDYNEHDLQDLLALHGRAYDINLDVFRDLQETLTGWPGGKPSDRKLAGDIDRPRDRVFPKRVIVFSPHPDDDVISMGGTLIRLADQGHEVHVAYQTSGNIAVTDAEALRFLDFATELSSMFGFDARGPGRLELEAARALRAKEPGSIDPPDVQRVKALIRRGEAKSAAALCGVPEERLHFMDLPFYETGRVRKRPLGAEDIDLTVALLRKVRPHQVYAAGDLSDPHGTHRTCLRAVLKAMQVCERDQWRDECMPETWLYRGAWQEWPVESIDMAVPLSPDELARKRKAIFRHQSQKDRPLFPGADDREFWQRAEDRNRATAAAYDSLGLPQYEAIEAFVLWDGCAPHEAQPVAHQALRARR